MWPWMAIGSHRNSPAPFGICLGFGAVCVAGTTVIAALLPEALPRLLIVAAGVAVCAAILDDVRASLATAAVGYLLFNGFLANRLGELTWDGRTSVGHVAAIATALGLGLIWRLMLDARQAVADRRELDELLDHYSIKEEPNGG